MPRGDALGELEHVVLLSLARLGPEAYGMAIRTEIERTAGRDVSIGSLYGALDRLERKGLVRSSLGDPTPERGGRAKRFYSLEVAGRHALARTKRMLDRLWEGLDLGPDRSAP